MVLGFPNHTYQTKPNHTPSKPNYTYYQTKPHLPKQTKPNKPKNLPKKTSNPNQSNKIKPTKSIIIKFISQIIKSKLFYSIKISKNLIKLTKSKNALSLAQLSPNLFSTYS